MSRAKLVELDRLVSDFRALTRLYYIGKSEIEGNGVFARYPIENGTKIGTAIIDDEKAADDAEGAITYMGSQLNHQTDCNAKLVKNESGGYDLVATKNIPKDEEITADYKDTPWYIDKNTKGFVEL